MSSLTGLINIVPAQSNIFTNTLSNDMIICTSSNSQKLILGVNSNSLGTITISSNLVNVSANLQTQLFTLSNSTGSVTLSNNGGSIAFPSGSIPATAIQGGSSGTFSQWSNITGGVGINSNVAIGSLVAATPLDVTGASTFRGAITLSNASGAISLSNTSNSMFVSGSIGGAGLVVGGGPITAYVQNPSLAIVSTGSGSALPSIGVYGGVGDHIVYYPGTLSTYPYSTGVCVQSNQLWTNVPTGTSYNWYTNNVTSMTLDSSANLTATGNISAYSDMRIKENVVQISNALDKIKQISGYTYTRNDMADKETRYAGVIAQEVNAVLPEVVNYNKDTDTMSVQYGNMIALVIEAIKELDAKVDALKSI